MVIAIAEGTRKCKLCYAYHIKKGDKCLVHFSGWPLKMENFHLDCIRKLIKNL